MDFPGKLRADLKRIYGAADPLNYVEDARAETNPDTQQEEIVVRLRVPRACEKYMSEFPISPTIDPCTLEYWAHEQARIAELLSYPITALGDFPPRFVKPKQVFFNGNHTTLVWPDDTKTSVGLGPDGVYNEYAGFCAAIVKKLFGSSNAAEKFLNKVKVVQKPKDKKKKSAPEPVECADATRGRHNVTVERLDGTRV